MSDANDLDLQAQRDFEMTQIVRRNMVSAFTANTAVPTNKEDTQFLLQTMRDMDAQNIARLRIKVDEKQADNSAMAAATVSAILREVNPRHFAVPTTAGGPPIDVPVRVIPDDVSSNYTTLPGEMSVNPPQGNIEEFMARMKPDVK